MADGYYKGKVVLVTGGAGFIGSHLVDTLVSRGARVTVVDNFLTGSRDNLAHLPEVAVVKADICDLREVKADLVFNLACPASPIHYQRDPVSTWRCSVIGGYNIATACVEQGARLVHASTSEVYGDPLIHPQPESYWGNVNPNGPRACYDEGKRAAETLILDLWRMQGLDARIARIFNTYGPRMATDDGRAVSAFVGRALAGKPLEIFGDGSQTRSFCFVTDTVDGLLRLGAVDALAGEVVNIGNPDERSIAELAQMILELTGSNSPIQFRDLPADDPVRRRPDVSKAKRLLEWAPTVTLRDGLVACIAEMKDRFG